MYAFETLDVVSRMFHLWQDSGLFHSSGGCWPASTQLRRTSTANAHELSRLRASTATPIIQQLGWQSKMENRGVAGRLQRIVRRHLVGKFTFN